jgi:hypothetical protein
MKHIFFVFCFIFLFIHGVYSQTLPDILMNKKVVSENYLPDYSYAGYQFGEREIPVINENIVLATDFGVIPNDKFDDSKALLAAMNAAKTKKGKVVLQLPAGRIILSDILYVERDNFVLRGMGSGPTGTELFYPRPMMYLKDPEALKELREYLVTFDKVQREKEFNIDIPFSQYAWSGGFIWTQVPGERVKSYLEKYERENKVLANVISGKIGQNTFTVSNVNGLKVGDVVQLELYNKDGMNGEIINELYHKTNVKPGSHHWMFPKLAIVRQQVEIVKINKNVVTIKTPLTINIKPNYQGQLIEWKHLKEVGIEDFKISFPDAPYVAHHVERGNNGIFLTRLFHSWVKNVVINNADTGIQGEEIANVTIKDIVTGGDNQAHYTVALGGVHNVLVQNLKIYNNAVHPLSFNTFSTKSVYKDCEIFKSPLLDQHSGANHQNLFDNITVHIEPNKDNAYPLFIGGGADYWKPSHGAFSTFWNINVLTKNYNTTEPILLNGIKDGPLVRIIGVNGNQKFKVEYEPNPYIERINKPMVDVPSLYDYQFKMRKKRPIN